MFRMSDEQKQKVLNNFKKVIKKRDTGLVSKDLYYHLNLNCNFIAHFNLQGFREAYSGENFSEFLEQFNRSSPTSQWIEAPEISADFDPLNQAMVEYVESQVPITYGSVH